MTTPPPLFDRALRVRRRDRAASQFDDVTYLHQAGAEGIADRLAIITRKFPDTAVFGAANGVYGAALEGRFGIKRLLEFETSVTLIAEARKKRRDAQITFGDIEASPLASSSMDLIVFGLELHAANDPVGALIQARRALRPDGLFLAVTPAGATLAELRWALSQAEIELTSGLSPRVAPMADLRDLGGLLQRASFALPVADSDPLTIWHRSPLHLMRELRSLGETNVLTDRHKRPLKRAMLTRAGELYHERFGRSDGKVRTTVELAYLAGWAPSSTQQQPLRPGSAQTRLADALGVKEKSAGEKVDGSIVTQDPAKD